MSLRYRYLVTADTAFRNAPRQKLDVSRLNFQQRLMNKLLAY